MEIVYRTLKLSECNKIKEIDASQYIGRDWRNADGNKQLVEINYQETDFPSGFDNHLGNLIKTINSVRICFF